MTPIDRTKLRELIAAGTPPVPWRTGRQVGRTLYIGGVLEGLMDSSKSADLACAAVNALPHLLDALEEAEGERDGAVAEVAHLKEAREKREAFIDRGSPVYLSLAAERDRVVARVAQLEGALRKIDDDTHGVTDVGWHGVQELRATIRAALKEQQP